jgi:hypothetical protein
MEVAGCLGRVSQLSHPHRVTLRVQTRGPQPSEFGVRLGRGLSPESTLFQFRKSLEDLVSLEGIEPSFGTFLTG